MTKISDFVKICRACNNERKNLLNLFAVDCEDEPTLGEKFRCCTSLSAVEYDELPQSICYPCAKQLETAYKFNRMCRSTDSELRKYVVKNKTSEPKVELESLDEYSQEEVLDSALLDESFEEVEIDVELTDNTSERNILDYEGTDDENITQRPTTTYQQTSYSIETSTAYKQYACSDCGKRFFTPKALELHFKVHHKKSKPKPEFRKEADSELDECVQCDLVFGSRNEYKKHMQLHHGGKSLEYVCTVCGKRLRNRISYENHFKVHDTTDRPYACNVCGKEYTEYRYMCRHMLYHQSALYKCPEKSCSRSYNVKHKFVDHLRRHHQKQLSSYEVRQIQPVELKKDLMEDV